MLCEEQAPEQRIALVAEVRKEADVLLRRLEHDLRRSHQRLRMAGKTDGFADVTGSSALERAVTCTRDMLARIDEVLAELDSKLPRPAGFANGRTPEIVVNGRSSLLEGGLLEAVAAV